MLCVDPDKAHACMVSLLSLPLCDHFKNHFIRFLQQLNRLDVRVYPVLSENGFCVGHFVGKVKNSKT